MNRRLPDVVGLGSPPSGLVHHLDDQRVFSETELKRLIRRFRSEWTFAENASVDTLIAWMVEHTRLRHLVIRSAIRSSVGRYLWSDATSLEVAASLARSAYFSHATAASIHGLLTYIPEVIYLNREQSAKPAPGGPLNQDAIDRAFSSRQRASQDVYYWGKARLAILSGKHSGRLGVKEHIHHDRVVEMTDLERTLIDLTVRPDYAGGPGQVLESFRRAQSRLSVDRLIEILRRLDYRYPYHQAVGFLHATGGLQRA